MSANQRPYLVLQPSVNTKTVVTTTTTTTTYAPIQLPPLPPPLSPKDPKTYPLLHATLPQSLRNFPLVFPGGARATFRDGESGEQEMQEEQEVAEGSGWHILKRDEETEESPVVGLAEAVERYGKKRSHGGLDMMEGVEATSGMSASAPPRKKARAGTVPHISPVNAAAPPSPLPSPRGSPAPESIWPSAPPSGASSPLPQAPFQPDLALTTLLTLPSLLSHFSSLPASLQSHFLLTLLRHSPLPVLRTLHSVLTPTLARDFLTLLPPELVSHVLSFLPFSTLARASRVSKAWRATIDSDPVLWRDLLKSTKIWFGGDSENAFADSIYARRRHAEQARLRAIANDPSSSTSILSSLPLPHPYKILFKSRHLTRSRWVSNPDPKHVHFPAHGNSVVTCLIFSHGRIISASDDHSIHIYSPTSGELIRSLHGHEGGVWALAASKDILVSGSTDRTVRIWDLATGRCTHVFGGHTSTVRCLAIVKPEWVDVEQEGGGVVKERWPKRPLIVTGSRDHSLRVWTLPRPGEMEYKCVADDGEIDPTEVCDAEENPYHRVHLEGHDHAVRALAARGRTLVSGSYDCTVRIWDTVTGACKWVLVGHTQKVYSVVLDPARNQACSGSMDGTVRVWDLRTGQCQHTLTGHTSLVGLLGLSPSYLVSAAADSTLRIWDPETGELRHTLAAHTGAITCFQHDEFKVLSGSDGNLKMWNVRDGTVVRDLLTGITGVWQVVFEGRWCVAASNQNDTTMLDVWDFGNENDEDWIGEPPGGMYDEDGFSEAEDEDEDELGTPRIRRMTATDDEDEEQEQADVDAMDQDLLIPSDSEPGDIDIDVEEHERQHRTRSGGGEVSDADFDDGESSGHLSEGVEASRWAPAPAVTTTTASSSRVTSNQPGRPSRLSGSTGAHHTRRAGGAAAGGSSTFTQRTLPSNDETPTRPRTRAPRRR
ncbi:Cell division control protein 4 [Hypsizygus marmoreus]|uniref:Cell division control protein 4 n=1 Tax=Hypsizygus marmoreus TaxID=39966 RepID=A0A369JJC2_HYPMA|nr:Cell division control protein 4 [Hypsizygus marmoreus]